MMGVGQTSATRQGAACAEAAGTVRRVSVLGATGSVGQSTLDVIARNPHLFEVAAVTANGNAQALAQIAVRHRARIAVLADKARYGELKACLAGTGIEAAAGAEALLAAAAMPADCVMAAITGAAGLRPTLAAVGQGRRVALANKECLVCAGRIFMESVRSAGTELVPVDSEHSAIFQLLAGAEPDTIERIVLTASGGPFRTWSSERLERATPQEALRHPNWSMGRKITIDSATLMNKGLELIEAYHLFAVGPGQLEVVVHPQSIVHALVGFRDGSMLAQLASPDMRTPIATGLAWPARIAAPTKRIDLVELGGLSFERPDETRFRALAIARQAMEAGGMAPCVLNAANEVAVEAFLAGRIGFLEIARLVGEALEAAATRGLLAPADDAAAVLAADAATRQLATHLLQRHTRN
ncbi:MAG: 1-deoxy-D-xylulose-5-phosphate reductoisomerase [Hyphomicrobiaceae bacterium]|nr:1-deoxy-D-xylulose-5-phosphate reductoisomerase [Hyphomicrobiaceae bacterium]